MPAAIAVWLTIAGLYVPCLPRQVVARLVRKRDDDQARSEFGDT
jgi:hypothetical protein